MSADKGESMGAVAITATQRVDGWELAITGEGEPFATVRTLDKARQAVIDHLDTATPDADHSATATTIVPADATLAQQVREVRDATTAAAAAQEAAARSTRDLVAALDQQGFKSADIAGILGVSRGRVSQLLSESRQS